MKSARKLTILWVVICLPALAAAEVAVIVHPSNGVTMDGQAIGRVFLGKTESFPNGSKAVPIELAEDVPTREEFNTKVLKKSAVQLKSYWSRRLFTGKGSPPKQLPSSDDIIDLVSTNPNIIGYVDAGKVNDSVKVIAEF